LSHSAVKENKRGPDFSRTSGRKDPFGDRSNYGERLLLKVLTGTNTPKTAIPERKQIEEMSGGGNGQIPMILTDVVTHAAKNLETRPIAVSQETSRKLLKSRKPSC